MGRTIPSYRIILEEGLKRWERFREALRIEERAIFQDMMDECRRHASAAGAACIPSETEAMFLTILFAHHKALKELERRTEYIIRLTETVAQVHSPPEGLNPKAMR
jgi:hypothetical protein